MAMAMAMDATASLEEEVMARILGKVEGKAYPCSEVCKRWLRIQGQLRRSVTLKQWSFLESGRMAARFPNLTRVDLSPACLPPSSSSSFVLLSHPCLSLRLPPLAFDPPSILRFLRSHQPPPSSLFPALRSLADSFPALQHLCLLDLRKPRFPPPSLDSDAPPHHDSDDDELPSADEGLSYIARHCPTLQVLELRQCTDDSLSSISACKNLQILRLVGSVDGFYHCSFTDIGLTILARSCTRLVKLELSGCEASYDGIAAIGQCCLMLEELTLSNRGFYEGWVAALSFCSCLKTLRLENCKQVDPVPGPLEHLGLCVALERLHFVRCDLRDESGFHALMHVGMNIRELELQDCWGLEDITFSRAAACRRVKLLALEGCSPLTAAGLEAVVLAWKDLQALRVVYCNSIKDAEISPALALQFCTLKELKWRPDTKSLLSMSLAGTGIGLQGGKFFKKGGPS